MRYLTGLSSSTASSKSRSQLSTSTSTSTINPTTPNIVPATPNIKLDKFYQIVKGFLQDFSDDSENRTEYRKKLLELSKEQFNELAIDIYDEAKRRTENHEDIPFLPVIDHYSKGRNQSRQKLATYKLQKFKGLASDVYYLLSINRSNANLPRIKNQDIMPKPQPNQYITITPTKGSIRVENTNERQQSEPIERTVRMPSAQSAKSEPYRSHFNSAPSRNTDDIDRIKAYYNNELREKEKKVRKYKDAYEELQKQTEKNQQTSHSTDAYNQLKKDYKELEERYKNLKKDQELQEHSVRKVKEDTKELLGSLKSLTQENEELCSERKKLRENVEMWKLKYEEACVKSRNIKDTNVPSLPKSEAIIIQDCLSNYKCAIKQLLELARSTSITKDDIREVMSTCVVLVNQIDKNENTLLEESKEELYDLKPKFKKKLRDLVATAENCMKIQNDDYVGLLQKYAKDLTDTAEKLSNLAGTSAGIITTNIEANDIPPYATTHNNIFNSTKKELDKDSVTNSYTEEPSGFVSKKDNTNNEEKTKETTKPLNIQKALGTVGLSRPDSVSSDSSLSSSDSYMSNKQNESYKNSLSSSDSHLSNNRNASYERSQQVDNNQFNKLFDEKTNAIILSVSKVLDTINMKKGNEVVYKHIYETIDYIEETSKVIKGFTGNKKLNFNHFLNQLEDHSQYLKGLCSERLSVSVEKNTFLRAMVKVVETTKDLISFSKQSKS